MMRVLELGAAAAIGAAVTAIDAAAAGSGTLAVKEAAVASVEAQAPALADLATAIWGYAETALREARSSAALAAYAEAHGFRVERGVAGMPTAFIASYGTGRPVVAVVGEYDALPGISQNAVPRREPREAEGAGHGCGHNLFGPASLGAAVAIRERIEAGDLGGTIRFYGTPAEEAVGGKTYMLREGLFDDVDVVLAWHPDFVLRADTRSSQAMVDFRVRFRGRAAHAAYDPWNGRSALDGAEIFLHALNLMREHVRPTVRMHYTIVEGGGVPNVVPETAAVWCWVRDVTRDGVAGLMERMEKMVRGAALAADVEGDLAIQSGSYEMLPSVAGARAMYANLEWLGPIAFSDEEQEFGRELQRAAGVEPTGLDGEVKPFEETPQAPEGGSTDVADLSWVVPTIHLTVPTAPPGVPWHAWPVVAASGSPVGRRGMVHAARALAATMVDLFRDPDLRAAIQKEFEAKTAGHRYAPFIPDGPPPLPAE
jgi:aminobenzoyl-glutamate utilization protein B